MLSFIMAYNAGWKRRGAVSDLNTLQTKINELDLRYRDAINSYDALEKKFKKAQKELQEQALFNESIKEVLSQEQQKSAALRKEIKALKKQVNSDSRKKRRRRTKD